MNPFEAMLRGGISLIVRAMPGESKGVITEYVPNAPASYGQPRQGTDGDVYGQISAKRMREIVLKATTVAGATNAILDHCSGVTGVRDQVSAPSDYADLYANLGDLAKNVAERGNLTGSESKRPQGHK
jgi:hypothetical protein